MTRKLVRASQSFRSSLISETDPTWAQESGWAPQSQLAFMYDSCFNFVFNTPTADLYTPTHGDASKPGYLG